MGRWLCVSQADDLQVIILAGPVLADFIAKHDVIEEIDLEVREAQLKLATGFQVAKHSLGQS